MVSVEHDGWLIIDRYITLISSCGFRTDDSYDGRMNINLREQQLPCSTGAYGSSPLAGDPQILGSWMSELRLFEVVYPKINTGVKI